MLILVDNKDNQIGIAEKVETHRKWLLHRAFSLLVYNDSWELLLQKRAESKYHSALKWTNTCCSHPEDWEWLDHAIHRRIQEEMWFDTEFIKKTEFIYNSKIDRELTEHEYLHIYEWIYNWEINLNPEEACDYKWMKIENIQKDIKNNPGIYANRFQIMFEEYSDKLFE